MVSLLFQQKGKSIEENSLKNRAGTCVAFSNFGVSLPVVRDLLQNSNSFSAMLKGKKEGQ